MPEGSPRPIVWMGSTRRDLHAFPQDVRSEVGFALYQAQLGSRHESTKIMTGFGSAGVLEIRADDKSGAYRAVYTVQFGGVIYALHAFQKKSKKGIATPKQNVDLIKKRLKDAKAHYAKHKSNFKKE